MCPPPGDVAERLPGLWSPTSLHRGTLGGTVSARRGPGSSPPWAARWHSRARTVGRLPYDLPWRWPLGTTMWLLCVQAFSRVFQELPHPLHRVLAYLSPGLYPMLSPREVGAGPCVHCLVTWWWCQTCSEVLAGSSWMSTEVTMSQQTPRLPGTYPL